MSDIGKDPRAAEATRLLQEKLDHLRPAQPADTCSAPRPLSVTEVIDELFTYHAPNAMQQHQYEEIREAAKYFCKVLVRNTTPGADQSAAIRKLRECVMTANASVALRGLSF